MNDEHPMRENHSFRAMQAALDMIFGSLNKPPLEQPRDPETTDAETLERAAMLEATK